MAKQFCIVHQLVASDCDCAPAIAQAKEYITTNECMGVPFLVRMGGVPEGIDPHDQTGVYVQTWRRTYDGMWRNELVSFQRKQ